MRNPHIQPQRQIQRPLRHRLRRSDERKRRNLGLDHSSANLEIRPQRKARWNKSESARHEDLLAPG